MHVLYSSSWLKKKKKGARQLVSCGCYSVLCPIDGLSPTSSSPTRRGLCVVDDAGNLYRPFFGWRCWLLWQRYGPLQLQLMLDYQVLDWGAHRMCVCVNNEGVAVWLRVVCYLLRWLFVFFHEAGNLSLRSVLAEQSQLATLVFQESQLFVFFLRKWCIILHQRHQWLPAAQASLSPVDRVQTLSTFTCFLIEESKLEKHDKFCSYRQSSFRGFLQIHVIWYCWCVRISYSMKHTLPLTSCISDAPFRDAHLRRNQSSPY